jgi:methylmalonyl-CoA epimerase
LNTMGIDHVGVAVKDKETASRFLTEVLGARKVLDEQWEYRGQEFKWAYFDVGAQCRIELISSTDPDSFINRFIEKRGEGMHHVSLQVDNLLEAVDDLRSKGITVLDVNTEHPHWKEAFISPRDSFGVLIQIAEFDQDYWTTEENVQETP